MGAYTARLTVTDGTSDPVVATRVVDVPAGTSETFDVELRGTAGLTTEQLEAFTQAEAYWESAIVRGIADVPIEPRPACLPATSPDLPPIVDDLIIDVGIAPIDGVGQILGQAGPTCFSTGDDLPIHGIMEFDSADVADLIADGLVRPGDPPRDGPRARDRHPVGHHPLRRRPQGHLGLGRHQPGLHRRPRRGRVLGARQERATCRWRTPAGSAPATATGARPPSTTS